MGMYTAMFGRIKLKADFSDLVRIDNDGGFSIAVKALRKRAIKKHPDVVIFLKDYRHQCIGSMMAAGWESYPFEEFGDVPERTPNLLNVMEPKGLEYHSKTRELLTCTTIKDYTDTYQKFYNILPLIAEEWDLKEIYEEHEREYEPDSHVSCKTSDRRIVDLKSSGLRILN